MTHLGRAKRMNGLHLHVSRTVIPIFVFCQRSSTESSGVIRFIMLRTILHSNDFPSMAREFVADSNERMMVVWQKNTVHSDIYYSYNNGVRWLYSSALTHDSVSDNSPCVAPRDSGFDVAWERSGQIMFSEFHDSAWSPFEQVTHTPERSISYLKLCASIVLRWWSGNRSRNPIRRRDHVFHTRK